MSFEKPQYFYLPESTGYRAEVNTNNATYSFIYGPHSLETNPLFLPNNPSVIYLENLVSNYIEPKISIDNLSNTLQTRKVIAHAKENNIALGLIDVRYEGKNLAQLIKENETASKVTVGIIEDLIKIFGQEQVLQNYGLNLLLGQPLSLVSAYDPLYLAAATGVAISNIPENEFFTHPMRATRRQFLSNSVRSIVAGYFGLPLVKSTIEAIGISTNHSNGYFGEIEKLSSTVQPQAEFFSLTLRNLVIAEKLAEVAQNYNTMGQRPHLVTLIGPAHADIENKITLPSSERLKALRFYKPVIEKTVVPRSFTDVVHALPSENGWVTTNITLPGLNSVLRS